MKGVLKKSLYPFTDWKWLLLPLATALIGFFLVLTWLGLLALTAYHDGHSEGQFAVLSIGYLATMAGFVTLLFASIGWLLRVARKPNDEDPYKLPNWSNPAGLVKEGLLAWVGGVLMIYLVTIVSAIPLLLSITLTGFSAHDPSQTIGMLGFASLIVFGCLAYLVVFGWVILFQPLLFARYANTGKFRHLFSLRWAWRAFKIAPWEYLTRISVWSLYLVLLTILTPLTMGVAYIVGYMLTPLSMINCIYLVGDYYSIYLDD